MEDERRKILTRVASGTLTPEEGAAQLDALDAEAPSPEPGRPAASPSLPNAPTGRQVRVVSQFGSAEIVGDPSVSFAVAEGPHRARQEGDTMVFEHEPLDDADHFVFGRGDRFNFQNRKLTVRMNPDLALLATVQAGNVIVDGVHGPITGDVQAGNCRVDDFRAALNLVVQAGNVTAAGRLDSGASKIRCEMGSVKVNLEKGSSVRITAHTTMGRVAIEGSHDHRDSAAKTARDVIIGSGAGTLDIQCTMGSVKVTAD